MPHTPSTPDHWRTLYQSLYGTTNYGSASSGKCPGVRYFPQYRSWLVPPVLDLGCGSGDTVRLLRSEGLAADGVDWIDLANGMTVADITKPLNMAGYNTALCIDVLEHIPEQLLPGLLSNLSAVPRQVLNVHTGPSMVRPGVDLHVTQHPHSWWSEYLSQYVTIVKHIPTERNLVRNLYLCRRPEPDTDHKESTP